MPRGQPPPIRAPAIFLERVRQRLRSYPPRRTLVEGIDMPTPARLLQAEEKSKRGEYRAALELLDGSYNSSRAADRILRGELLVKLGDIEQASTLLESTVGVSTLAPALKSRCHNCLGVIARYKHDLYGSVALQEHALRSAHNANDTNQVARVQLDLLITRAELFGPTNLGTLPSEAKTSVLRDGDPHLFACLHMRFGEVEMRRGALELAERHFDLALEAVDRNYNFWIDGNTHTFKTCIALLRHDFDRAFAYCDKALQAAQASGHKLTETAALSNKGLALILSGQPEKASDYILRARDADPGVGKNWFGMTENLAQIALARGDLAETARLLDILERAVPTRAIESGSWNQLACGVTRVKLLLRLNKPEDGLRLSSAFALTARARSDRLLTVNFAVLQAECLLALDRHAEAVDVLFHNGEIDPRVSLATTVELLRTQARAASAVGLDFLANTLIDRALRIQVGIARASDSHATTQGRKQHGSIHEDDATEGEPTASRLNYLRSAEAAASIVAFGCRADLLAAEVYSLLNDATAAKRVSVIRSRDGLQETILDDCRDVDSSGDEVIDIDCGSYGDDHFHVQVQVLRDFISRSFTSALRGLVNSSLQLEELRREQLRKTSVWPPDSELLSGDPVFLSPRMRVTRDQALRAARSDLNVLITGETGVGKEVIARMMHAASKRASRRFEPVVCAAVPRELFEGHLFGHRRGAFTGAIADSPGVIRANEGGTIFLDEIGELSVEEQVKLLRLLDAKEVHPLGSPQAIQVDIRIIAATNANLHELIEQKKFRSDLFHRLNAVPVRIPPLRERREEITPLMRSYLEQFCKQTGRPPLSISDEATKHLIFYSWPGNIRELKNEMERLAGLVDGDIVYPQDLKPEIIEPDRPKNLDTRSDVCVVRLDQKLQEGFDQFAKQAIVHALSRNNWNLDKVAKELGLTRKGLYNKRLRYSLT